MRKFLALLLVAILAFPALAAAPKVWYTTDGRTVWRVTGKDRQKTNLNPLFVEEAGYHPDSELDWVEADGAVWICDIKKQKRQPIRIPLGKGTGCRYAAMNHKRTIVLLSLIYNNNETLTLFDTKGKKLAETPGVMGLGNGNSLFWIDEHRFLFTYSVHGTKRGTGDNGWGGNWHGAAVFELFGEPGSNYFETLATPIAEPTATVDYEASMFDEKTEKCSVTKYSVKSPEEWQKEEPDFEQDFIQVPLPAAG